MRARLFPGCKMAASTVYKHRVLGVAILHPGNTYAPIGKFCTITMYLAELHFRNGYIEIGLLISSLHVADSLPQFSPSYLPQRLNKLRRFSLALEPRKNRCYYGAVILSSRHLDFLPRLVDARVHFATVLGYFRVITVLFY